MPLRSSANSATSTVCSEAPGVTYFCGAAVGRQRLQNGGSGGGVVGEAGRGRACAGPAHAGRRSGQLGAAGMAGAWAATARAAVCRKGGGRVMAGLLCWPLQTEMQRGAAGTGGMRG
jgi:hypothetical protein